MSAKASAAVTLSCYRDTQSITRYYKLDSSEPTKPTTNPPTGWSTAEPTYTSGSTNSLYFCDLILFSDGTFAYSAVNKSSSYQAAKEAYTAAQNAKNQIDNLKVGGRNLAIEAQWISDTEYTEYKWGKIACRVDVEYNETYTLTSYRNGVRMTGNTYGYAYAYAYDADGNRIGTGDYMVTNGPRGFSTKTITDESIAYLMLYVGPRNCVVGDDYRIKLEIGNTPSDWTPSPEEIATVNSLESTNQAMDELADRISERMESAELTISKIDNIISTLVVDADGGSLMEQTTDGWIFSMGETLSKLQAATDDLKILEDSLDATSGSVETLQNVVNGLETLTSYVRITTDGDEPCIELGNEGSFKVLITNTAIKFIDGTSVPAYVTNQSLKIGKAVVEDELVFGGFAFAERSNGNMGVIWKGDDV